MTGARSITLYSRRRDPERAFPYRIPSVSPDNERLHARTDAVTCSGVGDRKILCHAYRFKSRSKPQVATSRVLDQWPPHSCGEPMLDEQVPETIRTLVQVAHCQIGEYGAVVRGFGASISIDARRTCRSTTHSPGRVPRSSCAWAGRRRPRRSWRREKSGRLTNG